MEELAPSYPSWHPVPRLPAPTHQQLEDFKQWKEQLYAPSTQVMLPVEFPSMSSIVTYAERTNTVVPAMDILMERYNTFLSLSGLSQGLMLRLYGSVYDYLLASPVSPIEDYIISYEENMGYDNGVIAIGARLGIMISLDPAFLPHEIFFDKLAYILQFPLDHTILSYVINLSMGEFKELAASQLNMNVSELSEEELEMHYEDRLFLFATQLEK
jgi:hypothetical protein